MPNAHARHDVIVSVARLRKRPVTARGSLTRTGIQWTHLVLNAHRGCSKVSEGCRRCYDLYQGARHSGPAGAYHGIVKLAPKGPRWTGTVRFVPEQQHGAAWARQNGADKKGGDWSHWPRDLRDRQFPGGAR